MERTVMLVALLMCGCGDNVSTIDPTKPAQVEELRGGVQVVIDHASGEIFAVNHNSHSVGVLLADAESPSTRIFAKANIGSGDRAREGANLRPRHVLGTVYVYKDDVNGLALGALDAFGFNFDEHLHEDWLIPPVEVTEFTIR